MNEYFKGTIIGLSQTIVGHPFDTLKTLSQSNQPISFKSSTLFRGIQYPLCVSAFSNSLCFGTYSQFYKDNNNSLLSGFYSGIVTGLVLNPFEVFKIKRQTKQPVYINNAFNGMYLMITRESISTSIYFSTYYNLVNQHNYNPFIAGGTAGCSSWLFTYPIDTLKTRVQSGMTLKNAIRQSKFFNGLTYCLIRAFICNGLSFTIFDYLNKKEPTL